MPHHVKAHPFHILPIPSVFYLFITKTQVFFYKMVYEGSQRLWTDYNVKLYIQEDDEAAVPQHWWTILKIHLLLNIETLVLLVQPHDLGVGNLWPVQFKPIFNSKHMSVHATLPHHFSSACLLYWLPFLGQTRTGELLWLALVMRGSYIYVFTVVTISIK